MQSTVLLVGEEAETFLGPVQLQRQQLLVEFHGSRLGVVPELADRVWDRADHGELVCVAS